MKTGIYTFGLLALLVFIMAYATIDEHYRGFSMIYNSVWFILLWLFISTIGCYYITIRMLHKRLSVFLLHLSFLLILSGALVTYLSAKSGHVHLRVIDNVQLTIDNGEWGMENGEWRVENEHWTKKGFLDERTHGIVIFPFTIMLKSFEIEYYSGTNSPANYISVVEVVDEKTGNRHDYTISMNNILRYRGYRFYQSSFDDDLKGSILSVSRDTWGIPLTYAGYFLLFFSMLFVLFDKRERFRFLIKKLGEKSVMVVLLLGIFMITFLSTLSAASPPDRLSETLVEYQGRICPIQTLANDFTAKLVGKPKYKSYSGEEVMFGWLFFPEKWQHERMFKLKSEEMKSISGRKDGYACYADFVDNSGKNKLEIYYHLMYGSKKPTGWLKEAVTLNDKFHLIYMLQNGTLLKIVHTDDSDILPSATRLKAERIYNDLQIFTLLFKICLTLGSLSLLFFLFKLIFIQGLKTSNFESYFYYALWVVFVVTSIGLGLRSYIAGRFPFSNTYETLLLLTWLSLLTGILVRRYSFLIVVFSFLLSGFTLLVAHIGLMNPQITPLVPVLKSSLLSIHVLTIMVSYGLCGFMAFNSITALIVWLSKKEDKMDFIKRMKEISELFIYPATFLMGAGIFIGAIWANQSWGRYWGWDPKEVWALITFLLMGFTFHSKTLTWFRKPIFYHIFILIIFLSVLMTYFGVNFILGGKHSYAG